MRDEAEHKADSEAVEVDARRCRDAEGVNIRSASEADEPVLRALWEEFEAEIPPPPEDVETWEQECQSVQDSLKSQFPIFEPYHEVWHFFADADIRARDTGYRDYQHRLMSEYVQHHVDDGFQALRPAFDRSKGRRRPIVLAHAPSGEVRWFRRDGHGYLGGPAPPASTESSRESFALAVAA